MRPLWYNAATMESIRISRYRNDQLLLQATLALDDPALGALKTHYLVNKIMKDRVLFQLPQASPRHPRFSGYSVASIVQMVPGVAIVRPINATKLFNVRGEVTSIDDRERFAQPTFAAHLTNTNRPLHPLALGNFINNMTGLAYAPDTVMCMTEVTPEVERMAPPTEKLRLRLR